MFNQLGLDVCMNIFELRKKKGRREASLSF